MGVSRRRHRNRGTVEGAFRFALAIRERFRASVERIDRLGRRAWIAIAVGAFASVVVLAPALAYNRPDLLDLAKYKGKVVYLDFWASWCGPCRLSFPYMELMRSAYARKEFVVIAVNVDHSRERADAFLNQVGGNVSVVYDPKGAIAAKYHVSEIPTSVLIGRDGRVRYVHQGFFAAKTLQYESQIEERINEKWNSPVATGQRGSGDADAGIGLRLFVGLRGNRRLEPGYPGQTGDVAEHPSQHHRVARSHLFQQ